MTTLTESLAAFRQDLGQHFLLDPTLGAVDCQAGLAEDSETIVMMVDLSDGGHHCGSFSLDPGEPFDDDAREFVEDAFTLLASIECGLFVIDAGA